MIATSVSSARRATVRGGTIGFGERGGAGLPVTVAICPTSTDAGTFAVVLRPLRAGFFGGGDGAFSDGPGLAGAAA
jgi:hypothetical protein